MFSGANTQEVFRKILAQPALQSLEELYLNGGMTSDDALEVLSEFRQLPLTKIRLHKGWYHQGAMTDRGLGYLADSGHWRRLTELNVGLQASSNFLPILADGLPYSQLRVLRLHNFMWKGPYGCQEFANASSWGDLRELGLYYYELPGEQLSQLLSSPHLQQLRRLTLFGSMLQAPDLARIASCASLAGLRTLDLSANFPLGSAAAEHLRAFVHLKDLTDLKLIWTQIGDAGAEAIAQGPHFEKLRQLEVANNFITARGIKLLAESPHLRQLVRLRLFENPTGPWQRVLPVNPPIDTFRMNPETSRSLAAGHLPHLACAELHGYEFPAESVKPFLEAQGLKWVTLQPEQVASAEERQAYVARINRLGWMPPLDEYQEEEEPFV
jgi:hypothetical protein